MSLLVVFAFLAGAGTALSPCVLPVLPALLSAGATGGRRRPLGIVLGLAVTFTVTIVGLATVVDGVGLGDSFTRDLAIVALLVFGLAVAIPRLGDRLEAPLSRLARFGPRSAGQRLLVGPRRRRARSASSTRRARDRCSPRSSRSAPRPGDTVAVGLAYALGSSAVLLVLALAGRARSRGACAGRRSAARSAACWSRPRSRWRSSSTSASRPRSPTTCRPRS